MVHKGLRRFIEDDDATGLQAAVVPKVRRIVTFLQDMEREDELRTVPSWKAHQLTGDRKAPGACSSPRTGGSRSGSTKPKSRSSTSTMKITTRRWL